MIESIMSNTGINSNLPQEFSRDLKKAEELIGNLKKKSAGTAEKQLEELLIQYILANMAKNTAGAKSIMDQITSTIQTYQTDLNGANSLDDKLKSMEDKPTASGLMYLQNLITTLEHDLKTGDISNLKNL